MPSNQELSQRLNVPTTRPDPMTADDLATARGPHLASLRELIARRPGQYPNKWLACREGVSRRTIQRHKKLIQGLQVTPVYAEVRLHWGNLNELPDDNSIKGAFLQDETGKKYPPIPDIAAKLLAKGRAVCYRRQQANYYCMVSPQVQAVQRQALGQPLVICKPRPVPPLKIPESPPAPQNKAQVPVPNLSTEQPALPGMFPFRSAPQPSSKMKRISPRAYRKPLAASAQEALAQRVYNTINAKTMAKAECISLVSARKYVDTYGSVAVECALKLLERRRNVVKPVGFFATVLRGRAKFGSAS